MAIAEKKSVLEDAASVNRAAALIRLGARMQVLQSETSISYERLIRLYKEVAGRSPSKGQLPFSTDWFLSWQENIHSSLFLNIYQYVNKASEEDFAELLMRAYRLYVEQATAFKTEPLLTFTRSWRLVKFVEANMLTMTKCSSCGGKFVSEMYENEKHYVCGMCNVPARAGLSLKTGMTLH